VRATGCIHSAIPVLHKSLKIVTVDQIILIAFCIALTGLIYHSLVRYLGVSRKLRPRNFRPQTSDLENSDLENSDLETSDLETDLETSDP